jgi:hypothetical protein
MARRGRKRVVDREALSWQLLLRPRLVRAVEPVVGVEHAGDLSLQGPSLSCVVGARGDRHVGLRPARVQIGSTPSSAPMGVEVIDHLLCGRSSLIRRKPTSSAGSRWPTAALGSPADLCTSAV